ncbi:zinc finger protein [Culex quinquefasciatus]|uniref:Zinc finger protein n=1 Tax=Culex quinquefasciatus TaxID=7176 RepID=B0X0W4_CULQU|nr:zinc finger protein [Culex quinquefasciatus]|eukprot:XP_001863286.1 zinc finger protein [Culex quinquefasciatus]
MLGLRRYGVLRVRGYQRAQLHWARIGLPRTEIPRSMIGYSPKSLASLMNASRTSGLYGHLSASSGSDAHSSGQPSISSPMSIPALTAGLVDDNDGGRMQLSSLGDIN